jgi:exosortase
MVPVRRTPFEWPAITWCALLLAACYAPVLISLVKNWNSDGDMSHGFLVPVISAWLVWQKRDELAAAVPQPNWWGLVLLVWAALQLYIATLGAELFLARTAFIFSVIGVILLLCGTRFVRILAFPLFLLFFMVPIPLVIYNRITFPLQILASQAAEAVLSLLGIPVLREGNVLDLPDQTLNVVEACSGIRSLLSLSFLSLVYGYFFEKRTWMRGLLFFLTIPIAIIANAGRVTLTGILAEVKPELSEGFFHEMSGLVISMVALAIMILFHQFFARSLNLYDRKHAHAVVA